jgi:AraC-like DNA-binding protein
MNPTRYGAFIFVGVTNGDMETKIDYVDYTAEKDSLLLIMPTHITHFISGSSDFKGWVLSISEPYLKMMSHAGKHPDIISYMQIKKNPLTKFEHAEFQALYSSLDCLRKRIRQQSHFFHKEAIENALKMFFIDLGSLYLGKRENHIIPNFSRKEEIFFDFQSHLREHCKKQHDVKFYADKLCITTQYLTSILKDQSGKSAMKWIQEALMTEAKGMLKTPRINIQQVSNDLNFPDQSTFGKFFKKHTGVSPLEFRNN